MYSCSLLHLCIISYALGYVYGGSNATLKIHGGIHKVFFNIPSTLVTKHRFKRQFQQDCPELVRDCIGKFKTQMSSLLPQVNFYAENPPSMTPQQKHVFCQQVYQPFVDCIERYCEPSSTKDEIKLTLAVIDHMCIDNLVFLKLRKVMPQRPMTTDFGDDDY